MAAGPFLMPGAAKTPAPPFPQLSTGPAPVTSWPPGLGLGNTRVPAAVLEGGHRPQQGGGGWWRERESPRPGVLGAMERRPPGPTVRRALLLGRAVGPSLRPRLLAGHSCPPGPQMSARLSWSVSLWRPGSLRAPMTPAPQCRRTRRSCLHPPHPHLGPWGLLWPDSTDWVSPKQCRLLPCSSVGWTSEVRVPAHRGSAEMLFLVAGCPESCVLGGWGLPAASSIRALIPRGGVLPHDLINARSSHLLKPSHLPFGFQNMHFRDTDVRSVAPAGPSAQHGPRRTVAILDPPALGGGS